MKAALTQDEVIAEIKARMKQSGLTLTEFAEKLGVSVPYLRNILLKAHLPGPKIGYKKISLFVPIKNGEKK